MDYNDNRLPPELRALVIDVMQPPPGGRGTARIARGERAFDGVAACLGDGDPLLADIAEILWVEYYPLGDVEPIEAQLQRMVAVLDRPDAVPSHKLGMAFKRLAAMRMQQGQWNDAVALCSRGAAAFKRADFEDDLEAGKIQYMKATSQIMQGDQEAAREAFLASLPGLRQSTHGQRTDGHTQIIQALGFLGRFAMANEDPGDALVFYSEGLAVLARRAELSNEFFDMAVSVGRCLLDLKQPEEAEKTLKPMVMVFKKATHQADPSYLPRLHDLLGEARLGSQKYQQGLESYKRALAAGIRVYGPNTAEVAELYIHVSWGYQVLKDREAAVQPARQAVAIYERLDIDSTQDPRYVDAVWELAKCCLEAKHFNEADKLAQRMYEILEPIVGPTGLRIGQLIGFRGRIRFERGDHEGALALLEQGIELLSQDNVPAHEYLILTRMAAEIRLFHQPMDEKTPQALERVIAALKDATLELEEDNDRRVHRVGLTPRSERS